MEYILSFYLSVGSGYLTEVIRLAANAFTLSHLTLSVICFDGKMYRLEERADLIKQNGYYLNQCNYSVLI